MIAPLLGLLAAGGLSALNTQGGIALDRRRNRQDAAGLLAGVNTANIPGSMPQLMQNAAATGQMDMLGGLLSGQIDQANAQNLLAQRGDIQTALQEDQQQARLTELDFRNQFQREMAELGYQHDQGLLAQRNANALAQAQWGPMSGTDAKRVFDIQNDLDAPFQAFQAIDDYMNLFESRMQEGALGQIGTAIGELVPFSTQEQEIANTQRMAMAQALTKAISGTSASEDEFKRTLSRIPKLSDLSQNLDTALGQLELLRAEARIKARDRFRSATNFERMTGRQVFTYDPRYMELMGEETPDNPPPGFR
jgi:hypothetical protein